VATTVDCEGGLEGTAVDCGGSRGGWVVDGSASTTSTLNKWLFSG